MKGVTKHSQVRGLINLKVKVFAFESRRNYLKEKTTASSFERKRKCQSTSSTDRTRGRMEDFILTVFSFFFNVCFEPFLSDLEGGLTSSSTPVTTTKLISVSSFNSIFRFSHTSRHKKKKFRYSKQV